MSMALKVPTASSSSVRIARTTDAPAIQAIYAPYVDKTVISFELEPPTVSQMAERMAQIGAMFPWLVYEAEEQVVGYAYAGRHRERAAYGWSADATVYVAQASHRRGIGRALYGRLLRILALQGIHGVYGGITLPNTQSVGLHEALGFRHIGIFREVGFKMGAWRDVGWWGLSLNPAVQTPAPPLTFSEDVFILSANPG
jgi:phosphinothricin acetyltransferase